MTLNNDKKSAEDLTFCLKSDMRNLKIFDKNTQKSLKKFYLSGLSFE